MIRSRRSDSPAAVTGWCPRSLPGPGRPARRTPCAVSGLSITTPPPLEPFMIRAADSCMTDSPAPPDRPGAIPTLEARCGVKHRKGKCGTPEIPYGNYELKATWVEISRIGRYAILLRHCPAGHERWFGLSRAVAGAGMDSTSRNRSRTTSVWSVTVKAGSPMKSRMSGPCQYAS